MLIRNAPYKADFKNYNDQAYGLAKAMARKGISCDLINYSDKNNVDNLYKNGDVEINNVEMKGIKLLRTGIFPKVLNKEFLKNYDYIITTEYSQIMTYLLSRKNRNILLYSGPYYNLFKIKWISYIYDFLFTKTIDKNIKYKFVKSNFAKDYLEEKGYHDIINIGVGMDTDRYSKDTKVSEGVNQIVQKMLQDKYILYVGSLDDRKNFPFLLKVFDKFNKKHPEYKLLIVGKGKSWYVNKHLKELDINTRRNIELIPNIPNNELPFIFQAAKLFLLPSKFEIFGMVLLESMYFGLPVISSYNGGSSTLIDNNNSLIISEFDENLWVEGMEKILMNKQERIKMGELATKRITTSFTWDKILERVCSIIYENSKN